MEFIFSEKDLASREDFLKAAAHTYEAYKFAKRKKEEEERKLKLATERDSALDAAMDATKKFFSLFWDADDAEVADLLDYTLTLLRKQLIYLSSIMDKENGDGIKEWCSGVGVGHHTLTKSNKSNDSAKCNDSTKSNKPIEVDKAIKPAHGEIKFKRFNEPVTLTAHSDKPINLDLLPLINDKPATLKPIEEDELTKQLSKVINSLFEKQEPTNQLDELIDKLVK